MVREAESDDFDGLMRLYEQLHDNPFPKKTPQTMRLWETILSDRKQHVIVAVANGIIVSSCICVIIPNLTHGQRPYALVENVITDEKYRKQGFGKACLDFAKKIAQSDGCYKIMLMTGSKSDATLRFYEQAGYGRNEKTAFVQWL